MGTGDILTWFLIVITRFDKANGQQERKNIGVVRL